MPAWCPSCDYILKYAICHESPPSPRMDGVGSRWKARRRRTVCDPPSDPAAIDPGGGRHGRQDEHTDRGRGQGTGGRPSRFHTERGPGRPQRLGEDDAGGCPGPGVGRGQPRGAGRGRRQPLRLRGGGAPATAFGAVVAGPRGVGRRQDQPVGHTGLRRLRRGAEGRSAGGGRGPLRRLGRRRTGRLDPAGVGGVRGGRHAARPGHHPFGGVPRGLRRDDRGLPPDLRPRRPRRGAPPLPPPARRDGR